jgi:L-ascorbate metabolism protein UlaG (beta-lactamase superfamily)
VTTPAPQHRPPLPSPSHPSLAGASSMTPSRRIRRVAIATQAGIQRYSRELSASVREAAQPPEPVEPMISAENVARSFETSSLAACWIGHATTLIRLGHATILTDPVFSRRIGMCIGGITLGVRRLIPPALDIDHLPNIDLILLSHAHFDHLDRPSLQRLAAGPAAGATVITATKTHRLIPPGFGRVIELAWRGACEVAGVHISAIRPAHWGARTAIDHHRRFNAYVLRADSVARPESVLFAGDSAFTHAFDDIGPTTLSIFGIGAYDPWEGAHATPEQVWSMFMRQSAGLDAARLMPMHHSTFALGREPLDEPLRRLCAVAGPRTDAIVARAPGDLWLAERATTAPKGN